MAVLEESLTKYLADTSGNMLTIDRRDIINDDLGLSDDTAASFGCAANPSCLMQHVGSAAT